MPLLEKQLKRERQIHSMFNNPHEIFRVAFLSLFYMSSFCISHLSTQFCCVLFTHSSDLERKIATPRSKCLDIGGSYEFFLSILHCSFIWNCAHLHDFHCLYISFRKKVNLVSTERSWWSSMWGRALILSNNNDADNWLWLHSARSSIYSVCSIWQLKLLGHSHPTF